MFLRAVSLAILAVGCGGSTSAPTKEETAVRGTFLGKPFAAANAVSFRGTSPEGTYGVVVISSSAGLCSALQAGHFPPSSVNLLLNVVDIDAKNRTSAPTSTGQFNVTDLWAGPARVAGGYYSENDASCGGAGFEDVITQSGTVTLTGTDSSGYSGNFTILMSPDSVAGTFRSDPCIGAHLASPAPRC